MLAASEVLALDELGKNRFTYLNKKNNIIFSYGELLRDPLNALLKLRVRHLALFNIW